MNLERFIKEDITKEEALKLFELKGSDLLKLFYIADKIREENCGNTIHTCTITNAKSGLCSEDCKFCAQSAHYNTSLNTYDFKEEEKIKEEYYTAKTYNSSKFGIVTSGKSIKKGSKEFDSIKNILEDLSSKEKNKNLSLCASIGLLSYEEALELKKAGLIRYHCNLQTAPSAYDRLISKTHNIKDRLESIKNAKKAGLEICSGGIIGMGETYEERIEMAFALKELDVNGIPINILNPIKGTPYENMETLNPDEVLKTIAIYRIILKNKVIKLAAGREGILKDFMGTAFLAGANGMLIGGYLTLKGRTVEEDKKFIEEIKKIWAN